MAKVYVFLADGFEEIEALAQIDILRRAGVDVVSVSIKEENLVKGAHNILVMSDIVFKEGLLDADMLVLPGGGTGTKNLMQHEGLRKLILQYNKENKYLAAICAAPGVYGVNHLLEGKKAICYPGHEKNLYGAHIVNEKVVEDGNFITSKGPGTSIDFALALVEKLCGTLVAIDIKKGLQY